MKTGEFLVDGGVVRIFLEPGDAGVGVMGGFAAGGVPSGTNGQEGDHTVS